MGKTDIIGYNPEGNLLQTMNDTPAEDFTEIKPEEIGGEELDVVPANTRFRQSLQHDNNSPPSTLSSAETKLLSCNGRTRFFKMKHKQTRNDLKVMEKHSGYVIDLGNKVMEGDMTYVPELFSHYKDAIESYQNALVNIRVALLTERKLASEIWGPNNIAIYNKVSGEHTILDNIIEQLLHADYPSTYDERRILPKKSAEGPSRKRKAAPSLDESSDDEVPISQVKVEGLLPEVKKPGRKRKSTKPFE
uniref:Uncharacterized protein n=1 Tax=Panagrolaimus sp. JU765 TaxID=591449 RepID=A0AC34QQZ5_9BILA